MKDQRNGEKKAGGQEKEMQEGHNKGMKQGRKEGRKEGQVSFGKQERNKGVLPSRLFRIKVVC